MRHTFHTKVCWLTLVSAPKLVLKNPQLTILLCMLQLRHHSARNWSDPGNPMISGQLEANTRDTHLDQFLVRCHPLQRWWQFDQGELHLQTSQENMNWGSVGADQYIQDWPVGPAPRFDLWRWTWCCYLSNLWRLALFVVSLLLPSWEHHLKHIEQLILVPLLTAWNYSSSLPAPRPFITQCYQKAHNSFSTTLSPYSPLCFQEFSWMYSLQNSSWITNHEARTLQWERHKQWWVTCQLKSDEETLTITLHRKDIYECCKLRLQIKWGHLQYQFPWLHLGAQFRGLGYTPETS